ELGPLGVRFGAVASVKPWLLQWLDGPLTEALLDKARNLSEHDAFVLSGTRGRVSMRLPVKAPSGERLAPWLRVFRAPARGGAAGRRRVPRFGTAVGVDAAVGVAARRA